MPDFPSELVEAIRDGKWTIEQEIATTIAHADGQTPIPDLAALIAARVVPLIQQAERDRLAKQAGTNPYIDGDGIPTWAAWEAWDEGAACGVAAERERRTDDLEAAWGLIANAWNGNWNDAPVEWLDAAARFRDDRWHPLLDAALSSPVEPDTEASNE